MFEGPARTADLVLAPNSEDPATGNGSTSQHHGGFDSDQATVRSTFQRILGSLDGLGRCSCLR